MPECDNDTSVELKTSFKARNEAMALLLELIDNIEAEEGIESHMVHIPGVVNRVSDTLSREGVTSVFFSHVKRDFPHIRHLQDVSGSLTAEVRSLHSLL